MFPGGSNVIIWILKRWRREAEELEPDDSRVCRTRPDSASFEDGRGQEPRNEGNL